MVDNPPNHLLSFLLGPNQGVKARMLGRQNERNFCYVRLALTSIFGVCFMSVCLIKSNCYSYIYIFLWCQLMIQLVKRCIVHLMTCPYLEVHCNALFMQIYILMKADKLNATKYEHYHWSNRYSTNLWLADKSQNHGNHIGMANLRLVWYVSICVSKSYLCNQSWA